MQACVKHNGLHFFKPEEDYILLYIIHVEPYCIHLQRIQDANTDYVDIFRPLSPFQIPIISFGLSFGNHLFGKLCL